MIEIIGAHEDAPNTLQGFGRDPLIASMLLIHNLHPDSIEARVRRTITDLEASARKHDATIELISAEEALVKVHIRGGQPGRPFGPIVEQALRNGVPDAAHIIVEEPAAAGPSFVPLEALQKAPLAEATVLTEK